MSETRHKTISILKRKDIDPEKIQWTLKWTKTEGRPYETSFDRLNPQYQKLVAFLEDQGGYFEDSEFKYQLFTKKRGIYRRKLIW